MITTINTLIQKEIRDAKHNRWFSAFAIVFTGLAMGLSLLGFSGLGNFGVAGFGRTAASLINLIMLIVPLMGLLLGSIAISAERENGRLMTILAQPVTPIEVLIGKFLGLAIALAAAVLIGFGLSGFVIAMKGGFAQIGDYLLLTLLTLLIGWVHLSLGFCLSVFISKSTTALSTALIAWLAIVFVSDLGLIGTSIVLRISPKLLLFLVLINPVQVFKLAAIDLIQGNLELLGASGMFAEDLFGNYLPIVFVAWLTVWIFIPIVISIFTFNRRKIA